MKFLIRTGTYINFIKTDEIHCSKDTSRIVLRTPKSFGTNEQNSSIIDSPLQNKHFVKSVRIRSFSGPNAGKYGPENLRIRTLFTQWIPLPFR